ncbi:cell division initiation protein [Catalinimonas alkaloidigena]|uniref:DivIVA domain-containing protein n=1 Tax=Catalinimonas alkaloidigena TaxID=1075417 RepID=UPI002404A612|nr:DivIVA domain-containing protein [Catalinimonas alkaloidigena]MDF9800657.1 cell division initiation protein [Catalinimonas alkaloidigena]
MKITPLEIRQKDFEKNFRGYDKDEVNAFLQSLSQQWERTLEENKEMRYKLDASQKEVEKLREVESSLFKTLKTAEDTGANMVDQAQKTADLKIREAKLEANTIISDAHSKARDILSKAEGKAQEIIDEMEERVKMLKQSYKAAENDYDTLLFELRSLAQKTLQKVDKAESQQKFNIETKVEEAERIVEEYNEFLTQRKAESERETENTSTAKEHKQYHQTEEEQEAEAVEEKNKYRSPSPPPTEPKKGGSFFDNID